MVEDTYQQVDDRTFTDGFRGLLGRRRQFKVARTLQPVVLVGRNPTTDTQPYDPIVDTTGRVLVNAGIAGAAPGAMTALSDLGLSGNASIPVGTAGLATGTYEIHALWYQYVCDATVVTRTTAPVKLISLYDSGIALPVVGTSLDFYASPTLSLTASQDGFVALSPGGIETKNQFNTLTPATGKFTLPITISHIAGVNLQFGATVAAATNGTAGDTHRLIIWGKRVG